MPRLTFGFSLKSLLGNALTLSLQSSGLQSKNLHKQAWQVFFFWSRFASGRFKVETPGIEPGSKQAIQIVSTCLVFAYFSIQGWPKTAHLRLSFFVVRIPSKHQYS